MEKIMCDNIVKFIFSAFRWEEYKKFFQIAIFKYLIMWFSVVPIIATVVDKLPKNFGLENVTLPFNWTIMWLSSFFFVLAFLLYIIFCPTFVKKYNTFSDYKNIGHDIRWLTWESYYLIQYLSKDKVQFEKFVSRMKEKKFIQVYTPEKSIDNKSTPNVYADRTEYIFSYDKHTYSLYNPIANLDKDTYENGFFYEIFGRYTESKKWARISISILLKISALLFLIVFGQHIITGLNYIIH